MRQDCKTKIYAERTIGKKLISIFRGISLNIRVDVSGR